ncbi:MAG TPA: class II aldolase/adducin family protein [Burkholderiales bacterium]|nr:class II aldolase/adducin family protein [Burkholderiales bacterium]
MSNSLRDSLERLALACRILEMEGHGDMTLGHFSLRDPDGRGFWMKRNRAGLGEITSADDFVLVDMEGNKIAGSGGRHSEWPIHSEIYRLRPDINAVAHTHPEYASVFSASEEPLLPYTLDADYFDAVPRHVDKVALINEQHEGLALAKTLGPHYAVLMANHGVTFCGTSIEHATCLGVFLEKACKAHIVAAGADLTKPALSEAHRRKRNAQIMMPRHIDQSWDYFCRKIEALQRKNGGDLRLYA